MNHLSPEELSATLDGVLENAARERAERHLAECAQCRKALADLAAQDTALRPLLEHDPGEAYFENFAARVEDRIRAAGLRGAQSRLGSDGWLGWLSAPRRLAWVGAVAAVAVGAGIVMLTTRPQPSLMQSPELLERSQQDEAAAPKNPPQPAAPEQEKKGALAKEGTEFAPAPGAKRQKVAISAEKQESDALGSGTAGQEELAPAPAATAPSQGAPSPRRAMEVRRSAAGEDVPVRADKSRFAEPPPATGAVGDLKAAKPRAAQPMEQQAAPSNVAPLAIARDQAATQLCGRVVDARQRPVAGATVALADQGVVTTAGPDGRFCLAAAAGVHELSVMAVGYEASRLQVRVEGESSEALVTLKAVSVLDQPQGMAFRGGRSRKTKLEVDDLAKFASDPTTRLAEAAAKLSARADSLQSAAAFDSAGVAWARVAGAAKDAPWLEARYRAAEARYRAWQLGPTATRARVARDALDAYLATAAAGARRDRVTTWRRQIGP